MAKPGVLILTLVLAAAFSGCATHNGPTRDVVVIARGMTFFLPDRTDVPNPVISLRAGERVRLVLQNDAPGLLHDLVIPAWDVEIELIRAGERRDVTFTVPNTPGQVEYLCRPHSEMMKGVVEITP